MVISVNRDFDGRMTKLSLHVGYIVAPQYPQNLISMPQVVNPDASDLFVNAYINTLIYPSIIDPKFSPLVFRLVAR